MGTEDVVDEHPKDVFTPSRQIEVVEARNRRVMGANDEHTPVDLTDVLEGCDPKEIYAFVKAHDIEIVEADVDGITLRVPIYLRAPGRQGKIFVEE